LADVKAVHSLRSLSVRSSWIRSCMDGMVAVVCFLFMRLFRILVF
jgi:hypothetical protein